MKTISEILELDKKRTQGDWHNLCAPDMIEIIKSQQAEIERLSNVKSLLDYLDTKLPIPEEGERDKIEEWQAAYAFLFKQMNNLMADLIAAKQALTPNSNTTGE